MGLFSKIKNVAKEATSAIPSMTTKYEIVEDVGKRSWKYVAEDTIGGSELANNVKNSGLSFSYNVENARKLSGTRYLQDVVAKIPGDTVCLYPTDWNKAKIPKGWSRDKDSVPFINPDGLFVGALLTNDLEFMGLKKGRSARVAVSRSPYSADGVELYVLFEPGYPREEAIQARKNKQMSENIGVEIPPDANVLKIFIDDKDWKESNRLTKGETSLTMELIPTPKESKAKPHVRINVGEKTRKEFSARSSRYTDYLEKVGVKPDFVIFEKKESLYEAGGFYWDITAVYSNNQ